MLEKIDAKKYQRVLRLARRHANVDVSSLEAMIALSVVAHQLDSAMECNLGRYNLSRGRFRVLVELVSCDEEGLSPAELAERIEVSRATMTGLLDTLEKEALITRLGSQTDRRTMVVKITAEGTTFAGKILPENFRRTNLLMQHLSLEEKEALVDLLAKVFQGLKAYKED